MIPYYPDAPAPLTGNDLEIARRLDAGQHPAHIADIGWYRQAWSPDDITRVALARLAKRHRDDLDRARAEQERLPAVTRDGCGSTKGVRRHQKLHERLCEPCRLWRNADRAARKRKRGAA